LKGEKQWKDIVYLTIAEIAKFIRSSQTINPKQREREQETLRAECPAHLAASAEIEIMQIQLSRLTTIK